MFIVGNEYSRDDINAQLGGSKELFLPHKSGIVLAACLRIKKNPRAPTVILCGKGPQREAAAAMLVRQASAIPVFIKRDGGWRYVGNYRPIASHTSGPEFESRIAGSGRDRSDVSRVIIMEPATRA